MFDKIEINFHSKEPLYYQIEEQVKYLITSGQVKPGEQLPTVRELADALEINFNTIARVYRRLDQQGFVSSQRGRGCYVLDRAVPIEKERQLQFEQMADSFVRQSLELGIDAEEIRSEILRLLKEKNAK
ncbi:MAG: GntR family transcriptional regulator [Anaerolineae bacterium]|jgi:GntR family transcriptional regulator|nr:GntR family transcriptional regulator [Anaerolineae bacterium]